jgi:hypothetical protein
MRLSCVFWLKGRAMMSAWKVTRAPSSSSSRSHTGRGWGGLEKITNARGRGMAASRATHSLARSLERLHLCDGWRRIEKLIIQHSALLIYKKFSCAPLTIQLIYCQVRPALIEACEWRGGVLSSRCSLNAAAGKTQPFNSHAKGQYFIVSNGPFTSWR